MKTPPRHQEHQDSPGIHVFCYAHDSRNRLPAIPAFFESSSLRVSEVVTSKAQRLKDSKTQRWVITGLKCIAQKRRYCFDNPQSLIRNFTGVARSCGGAPLRMKICGSKFQIRGSRLTSRRKLEPRTKERRAHRVLFSRETQRTQSVVDFYSCDWCYSTLTVP
jgi:hypothetical protein